MNIYLKKIFLSIFFNSALFLIMIIAIQNSSNKSKVNLLVNETINLPVSFIVGVSFISGSIFSNLFSFSPNKNK
ncbi:hypothetical protein [Prochlorococcus marinus]|uniref:hypothetical protein n=1 Tax=Prochlorococcus marinus TaxID=1219 RepID=UPI001C55AA58|nr:hypothetical protein [Prochlorococcus marinus]MBW3075912.1 hypothetical protein [Prochlorococcus marinus str. XMU1419]